MAPKCPTFEREKSVAMSIYHQYSFRDVFRNLWLMLLMIICITSLKLLSHVLYCVLLRIFLLLLYFLSFLSYFILCHHR